MSAAWVIRSGRYGERDAWALDNGVSGGGWQELPDLTPYGTREDIAEVVGRSFPEFEAAQIANYTGQLWALRGRIAVGDLMVMPLKTTKQIALGSVAAGYEYLAYESDPNKRHVVRVDWKVTDLPRSAVKQDLLYTLGSALSVFAPSKNQAVARLEALLATGTDPGASGLAAHGAPAGGASDDVDSPETQVDIFDAANVRISSRIQEEFSGHELSTLVAAILEADGFTCAQSPPGADRGIDIVAGMGPLGMDSPRVIVQVKSGAQISDSVVRDLVGVVHSQGADQGLIVAWGGLTKPARDTVYSQQFKLRAWTAEDVIDATLRTYDRLPQEIRARLPLTRVWILAE
jgi:restriction system protein